MDQLSAPFITYVSSIGLQKLILNIDVVVETTPIDVFVLILNEMRLDVPFVP